MKNYLLIFIIVDILLAVIAGTYLFIKDDNNSKNEITVSKEYKEVSKKFRKMINKDVPKTAEEKEAYRKKTGLYL